MTTASARINYRHDTDWTTTGAMLPDGWGLGGAVAGVPEADGPPMWIILENYERAAFVGAAIWPFGGSSTFIAESEDAWNQVLAQDTFLGITTSPGIDRRETVPLFEQHPVTVLLTAPRQVRELQAALSVNKSELARILRVSRPTVYDWLDDGEPNAENIDRILRLFRFLQDARVSSAKPLFPRLVRLPPGPGEPALLDSLREETLDETAIMEALRRAKAMGDAIDREREQREARLRTAGFEEVDAEQRKANLASSVALLDWPRE